MQPVFQQNSQRRSVRHAELLAVRARVSSQRPFLTGGGFLVLVISCGREAAKLFPQFPGTGCFLPLAVSYRRPFPVAGRFLRLAHHPAPGPRSRRILLFFQKKLVLQCICVFFDDFDVNNESFSAKNRRGGLLSSSFRSVTFVLASSSHTMNQFCSLSRSQCCALEAPVQCTATCLTPR